MTDHVVCKQEELADGDSIVVQIEGREIGIFNLDDEYHAYVNWCAHQSGPLCEGQLTGTTSASYDAETGEYTETWERDGEILNCPWHGWEYDVKTGECLSRSGVQLPSYDVAVQDGNVVLSL